MECGSYAQIYWSAILADFRRSGLTHVEFCRRRRISLHSFRKWLYQLRPGLPPKATRARSHTSPVSAVPATTATPRFLQVHVRAHEPSQAGDLQHAGSPTAALELVLPSDCRILVRPGFDPRCLRQLLDCLDGEPS
jgi:hypothetical protein